MYIALDPMHWNFTESLQPDERGVHQQSSMQKFRTDLQLPGALHPDLWFNG